MRSAFVGAFLASAFAIAVMLGVGFDASVTQIPVDISGQERVELSKSPEGTATN